MAEVATELIDDLEDATDEVSNINDELNDKLSWIQHARDNWPNRTSTERESFRQATDELLAELASSEDDTQDLIRTLEQIQQTYESPVLDSIFSHITEIIDTLGIESDDVEISLEEIESRFDDNLVEIRSRYDQINSELEKSDEIVVEKISGSFQQKPFLIYKPETIEEDISEYQESLKTLSEAASALEQYGWAPDDIDKIIQSPDRLTADSIDLDSVIEEAEDIEGHVVKFDDLEINPEQPIGSSLRFQLIEGEESLDDALDILGTSISNLTELSSSAHVASQLISDYPSVAEDLKLETRWDSIIESEYTSLEGFLSDLETISRTIDRWTDEFGQRWNQISNVAEYYLEEIDTLSGTLPDSLSNAINNGLPLEDPVEAYEIYQGLEEWLTQQQENLREEMGDEAVELLNDLIQSDFVRASEYSPSAIENVTSKIPLILQISDE